MASRSDPTKRAVKATAKQLQEVAKSLRAPRLATKNTDAIKAKKVAREIKSSSRQIVKTTKATAKQIKSLAKVFRDALGRFTSSPKKSKRTGAQPKAQPKRTNQKRPLSTSPKSSKSFQSATRSKPAPARSQKPSTVRTSGSKASQKKTKVSAPKSQGKLFGIGRIRSRQGESVLDYFTRLRRDEDSIDDQLKARGARFAFTYDGHNGIPGRSIKLHSSLKLALDTMDRYDLTKQLYSGDQSYEGQDEQLARSIRFVVMKDSYKDYSDMRQREREARKLEVRKLRREAHKLLGRENQPDFGSANLIGEMSKEIIALRKKLAKKESNNGRSTKRGKQAKSGSTKGKSTKVSNTKSASKGSGNKRAKDGAKDTKKSAAKKSAKKRTRK